ncbi:hypothetical protein ACFU96_30725 [Streptomyces sp. NPDC057620]|uniref:hypothetical protein n=1 Tax=Streptomyces sp. NPDC057620 TaxID=3346185 RepID=UPI00368929EA
MSRLADHIKAIQLGMAAELLEEAFEIFAEEDADLDRLSLLTVQLAGALEDVLRVATSRGRRLVAPEAR